MRKPWLSAWLSRWRSLITSRTMEYVWDVLLPGLAWRTYVVLQTLPAAIAVWKPDNAAAAAAPR